jgi:23S rRNA (guanosine2251-2'-O)-methyltransferase
MKRIYGRHPVLEALAVEGHLVKRVILAKGIRPDRTIATIKRRAEEKGISVEILDRKRLVSLTATAKHQGVLAEVEPPSPKDVEDILQIARMRREDPFILLLDGIEDPHNFGSILRSAEGMGVHGVIIGERRQVKLTPVVWKTSAGAAAYLTVAVVTNLAQTMDILQKKHNLMCVGLEEDGSIPCHELDFCQGLVLVVGSEGKGIRPVLRKRCEVIVRIPIKGRIQSYNASVAAAVILFEVMYQREKIQKKG